MRYLSVCSGIEAATVAWHPLGWTPAGFAEIEPFPRAVLEQRHGAVAVDWDHRWQEGQNFAPQNFVPLFGDFTQIGPEHVGPVDLLVGGTPCFPAGTLVATRRGLIPIQHVEPSDEVLTHERRFRKVLRTGCKMAATVVLKGQGHHGMVTTVDHPFLARKRDAQSTRVRGKAVRIPRISAPDWRSAGEMAGYHWGCVSQWPLHPTPEIRIEGAETTIDMDEADLMRMAGAYLGDGWARISERRGYIIFGINADKLEVLRSTFDAYGTWSAAPHETGVRVQISSRPLARWMVENFGAGAGYKSVPMWALGHPLRAELLAGYLATDGGKTATGYTATTISRKLALTLRMLAVSCGLASSVTFSARPAKHKIAGREVNQQGTYRITFVTNSLSSFEDGGARWQLVRSVEDTGRIEAVYDLEVEEDHSYVADGIFVHNCQSFSIAGLRGGLADDRGNLALEYLRLADRTRPRWLVWENVPGVLSSLSHTAPDPCEPPPPLDLGCDGAEVVTTDDYHSKELHSFECFLAGLQELGYGFAYRILDAQYAGLAQRRRRVFVVGYLGDWHRAAAVLFERHSLQGHPPPRRKLRQLAPTMPSRISADGGLGTDLDCDGGVIGQDWPAEVAPTLNAAFGSKQGLEDQHIRGGAGMFVPANWGGMNDTVTHTLRGEGFDASEDGTGRGTPLVPVAMLNMMGAKGMAAFEENPETSHTLTQGCQSGADMHAICFAENQRGEVRISEVGNLTVGGGKPGQGYPAICFSAKDHGGDAIEECSPTLRAGGHSGSHANGGVMPAVAYAIQERAASENPDAGPQGKGFQEGAAFTLEARNKVQAVAFNLRGRDAGAQPEVDPDNFASIRAASGGSSRSYVASFAVRRIMPVECERLQGFPDNYTQIQWRGKPADQCPDGGRYKALGNSMAVPCMEWIGARIALVEQAVEEAAGRGKS